MAKADRNNRGATKEITRADWRTPPPLFKAIEAHYGVTFVLDAAADSNNTMCKNFISREMDTLSLSDFQIQAQFDLGHRAHQGDSPIHINNPAIWCNPEYNDPKELYTWIDRGARFAASFKIPWLFLLPSSRSEQPWYQRAIDWVPQWCNPKGRVRYRYPDGTPGPSPNHPSVIIAFSAPRAAPHDVTSIFQPWQE